MRLISKLLLTCVLASAVLWAAGPEKLTIAEIQDKALSTVEKEVVSLAEAMPADKYTFAPTQGAFSGVRTFNQQLTHLATVLYSLSSASLGEKSPVTLGKDENGKEIQGKDATLKYLKDAFAYAHKATQALTAENYTEVITMPHGRAVRGALISETVWHSFDHYGQCVVYARMNDVIPPASRK
jgi:uncharacterized damage-inducible protein DinB